MADISKCVGRNCSIKDTCYRYLAKDGYWQAYFHGESGLNEEKTECKYHINNDGNYTNNIHTWDDFLAR
jgi:hypothetical protein